MIEKNYYNLSRLEILKILNNIFNEVYVTNKDLKILYVNKKCFPHYHLLPEEMINFNHMKFANKLWTPTIQPFILKEKKRMCIEQKTIFGESLLSTATPILNNKNEVEKIVSIVQEKFNVLDSYININESNTLIKRYKKEENSTFISRSPKIKKLMSLCKKAAASNISILIQGDTGTGKSSLAKFIHSNSPRKNNPFFTINCASIPENLIESELFGYLPNSFSGANPKGKKGLITLANTGTIFLDEIGELSLNLQAKLLTVIENHQFIPIGGHKVINVDIRIIAATNKNLKNLVKEGTFREDLFWRLNIIDFYLPSLSERKEDIVPISNFYLNIYNEKYNKNKFFTTNFLNKLVNYSWPGNIRQLKNLIENIFITSKSSKLDVCNLPNFIKIDTKNCSPPNSSTLKIQLEKLERKYISTIFIKYNTPKKMANFLNVSPTKANRLIKKYCF